MKWKTILMAFTGVVVLVFFSTIAFAPHTKFREIQALAESDSTFADKFDSLYFHPDIKPLLKERAYKEALLKQSQSDSIQLVVTLSDSTVGLCIKGVPIHQSKVSKFSKDKFLEKLPLRHEIWLLSQPLPVRSRYATIVKEPVVVREAPRDTLEAETNAWQPDTLVQNPAFASFLTEHGLQVIFQQEENSHFRDHWKKSVFYMHLGAWKTGKAAKNFLGFSRQEYLPAITINIPAEDLRAIYRALPDQALIVLKL